MDGVKLLLYCYIIVAIIPFFWQNKSGFFLFRLDVFLSITLLPYAVSIPINYLYFGNDSLGMSENRVFLTLLFHFFFLSSFLVGFYSFLPRKYLFPSTQNIIASDSYHLPNILIKFSFAFILILTIIYFQKLGGIVQYFNIDRLVRYSKTQDNHLGVFSIGIIMARTIMLLYLSKNEIKGLQSNNKVYKWVNMMLIILYAAVNLAVGDRRFLVGLIIAECFIFNFFGKLKNKIIYIIGLVGGILMQLFQYLRHIANDPAAMVQHFDQNSELKWLDISKGEYANAYLIFNSILESPIEYQFGMTYLKSFSLFFPHFILPNRFEGLPIWFVKTYYYDVYSLGGGFAFNFVAETYLNFGYIGPIIIGVILGWLFRKFWIYVFFKSTTSYSLTCYDMFLPSIFILGRVDFGGGFKEYLTSVLLPLGAIYLLFLEFNKLKIK